MKALEQHLTTSSGLKGRRSRYGLYMPPPVVHISYKLEMVMGCCIAVNRVSAQALLGFMTS